MRRFCLPLTFFLLVGALLLLWQHRFERSPDHRSYTLGDLRDAAELAPGSEWLEGPSGPVLRMVVDGNHQNIVARMTFPGLGPVEFLHVRHTMASRKLLPGQEIWQDGRLFIEWHDTPDSPDQENDPIYSTRYDREPKAEELVMYPHRSPAVPVLRVEHLGISGEMDIQGVEITILRESWFWKPGRWVLTVAWLIWLYALMRPVARGLRPGTAVVAVGWLFMGLYFVVPGPWKSLRPLGPPFVIGGKSTPAVQQPVAPVAAPAGEAPVAEAPVAAPPAQEAPSVTPPVASPASKAVSKLKALGKIPENGDISLTVKRLAAKSKWMLHVALLFVPVFFTACLVGRKQAIGLGVLFSLAVEVAQIGFGYGSDSTDLIDLAADAGGIVLALLAHGIVLAVVFKRRKVPVFFAAR